MLCFSVPSGLLGCDNRPYFSVPSGLLGCDNRPYFSKIIIGITHACQQTNFPHWPQSSLRSQDY